MKQFMVTLQSEIIRDQHSESLIIEAHDMAEALNTAAQKAIDKYDLTGWENMTITIREQFK